MIEDEKIRLAKERIIKETAKLPIKVSFFESGKNARKYGQKFSKSEAAAIKKNRAEIRNLTDDQATAVMDKICEETMKSQSDIDTMTRSEKKVSELTIADPEDVLRVKLFQLSLLPMTRVSMSPRFIEQFPSNEKTKKRAMNKMPWCNVMLETINKIGENEVRGMPRFIQNEITDRIRDQQMNELLGRVMHQMMGKEPEEGKSEKKGKEGKPPSSSLFM